jgi:hypothetical protein
MSVAPERAWDVAEIHRRGVAVFTGTAEVVHRHQRELAPEVRLFEADGTLRSVYTFLTYPHFRQGTRVLVAFSDAPVIQLCSDSYVCRGDHDDEPELAVLFERGDPRVLEALLVVTTDFEILWSTSAGYVRAGTSLVWDPERVDDEQPYVKAIGRLTGDLEVGRVKRDQMPPLAHVQLVGLLTRMFGSAWGAGVLSEEIWR